MIKSLLVALIESHRIFPQILLTVKLLMKATCKIGEYGTFVLKRTVCLLIVPVYKIRLCLSYCVVPFQLNYICIPDA